mgnify:FL=1|tara:strand:- start:801 stop:1004 length:204 start_codon:yes stop_codon:yes gene_type:complete
MEKALEILVTELSVKDDIIAKKFQDLDDSIVKIGELKRTLIEVRTQLLDVYPEDSVLIIAIDNALKK